MAVARTPRILLGGTLAVLLYAAFADGGTGLPEAAWLQLGLVVLCGAAAGWCLFAAGRRPAASRTAWVGLALLALFAAWTGLTLIWSVAPDRSWAALNRALAGVLVVVLGLVAGSFLPDARRRLAAGLAAGAALVGLYALAGKTVPFVRVPGVLDLDHAAGVSRLRAPLDYWNALALACVFGLPLLLSRAADPAGRSRQRDVALVGVLLLLVVLGMTYSRGGVLALAAALFVFFAFCAHRWRALALLGVAGLGMLVVLGAAFSRPDLTTNALPLERRADDGLVLLVVALVVAGAVLAGGRLVRSLERRVRWTRRRARAARRTGLAVGGGIALLLAAGIAGSGAVGSFTEVRKDETTDPARLLSTNSGNRWSWWQEAAGAWSDRPVRGWGAGSFAVTHLQYRRDELSVLQPHSVPLQFLAETGLVGTLLAFGGLLALLAAALARVRRARDDRAVGGALLAIPVAWLVHCWVDWDWDIPAVTLPALLVLGVLAARPARPLSARRASFDGRPAAFAAAVLLLLGAGLSAALPAVADRVTDSAYASLPERPGLEDLRRAAARAELAARIDPTAVEPYFAIASLAERRGALDAARAALLQAIDRRPYDVSAWFRLARLEFARGDRVGVRRAARRALELDPRNRAALGLAGRTFGIEAPPNESATATGTPLTP